MCNAMSTWVFVNNDITSCEIRISPVSIFVMLISCASSFEFLQWCSVRPRMCFMISTGAFDRLYVTEPMLSIMGCSGRSFL